MIKAIFKNSELTEYELIMLENAPMTLTVEFIPQKVNILQSEFPTDLSLLRDFYPSLTIEMQVPNLVIDYEDLHVTFDHAHKIMANEQFIEKVKIRNDEIVKLLKKGYIESGRFTLEFFQKVIG